MHRRAERCWGVKTGATCLSALVEECVCRPSGRHVCLFCGSSEEWRVCFHSHRLVWIFQIIPKTLVLQKPALNVWLFGYSFHFWTIKNKTSHSLNTQCFSRLFLPGSVSRIIDSSDMMISGTQLRLWTYKSHLVFARGSQWEEPLSKGRRKGLKQACCRQQTNGGSTKADKWLCWTLDEAKLL